MGSNSYKTEVLTVQYKNEQRTCNKYMKGKKSTSLAVPISGIKKNKQLTWGLCIIASKNHHQNPGITLDCYSRSFIHVIAFNTNINLGIIKKSVIKAPYSRLLPRSPETPNSKF